MVLTVPEDASENIGGRNVARARRTEHWSGIKFFDGQPLPDKNTLRELVPRVSALFLRDAMHVWRPEETVEAARIFFGLDSADDDIPGVTIIGAPQEGKGTILFGLSEICHVLGIGYVFNDGHHQETPGEQIAETIAKAEAFGFPVFFDSTDYLFIVSRNAGRTINAEALAKRTPVIISALSQAKIPIATTRHDGRWAKVFTDPDLRQRYGATLDRFPVFQIPEYMQSDESRLRFLLDHGVQEKIAEYLLNFGRDQFTFAVLYQLAREIYHPNTIGNLAFQLATENILSALHRYPVLKDMVRNNKYHFKLKLERSVSQILANRGSGNQLEIEGIKELGLLIHQLDMERDNLTLSRRGITKK